MFDADRFHRLPLVAILRGIPDAAVEPLVTALLEGGLTSIELTLDSPGAAARLRSAVLLAAGRANVGAGTVTSVARLAEAVDAGASFVVTPTLDEGVLRTAREAGLPVFPGAFSPAEIHRAHARGAFCVKVFPMGAGGERNLASLKAALPGIPLMPTGGVTLDSLAGLRRAGADAAGIGSPLVDPVAVAAADWDAIRERAAGFRKAWETGAAAGEKS